MKLDLKWSVQFVRLMSEFFLRAERSDKEFFTESFTEAFAESFKADREEIQPEMVKNSMTKLERKKKRLHACIVRVCVRSLRFRSPSYLYIPGHTKLFPVELV